MTGWALTTESGELGVVVGSSSGMDKEEEEQEAKADQTRLGRCWREAQIGIVNNYEQTRSRPHLGLRTRHGKQKPLRMGKGRYGRGSARVRHPQKGPGNRTQTHSLGQTDEKSLGNVPACLLACSAKGQGSRGAPRGYQGPGTAIPHWWAWARRPYNQRSSEVWWTRPVNLARSPIPLMGFPASVLEQFPEETHLWSSPRNPPNSLGLKNQVRGTARWGFSEES